MGLLAAFTHTLEITLPVFLMVFLGLGLKRLGWIDAAFINTASSLVFRVTMPTLLFLSIIQADLDSALQPRLILYFVGFTLASFCLAWLWAIWRHPYVERGIFTQGAFRANNGIVGLALAASQYGDYGLSVGGILAGAVIVVYNVVSVIVLSIYSEDVPTDLRSLARNLAKNPLILSVVLAIPVALLGLDLPTWLLTSGGYLGSMSLPLGLICIGGTLSITAFKRSSTIALDASLWKLVWVPLLGVLGALALGIRGPALGILFLFLGSPGAAASFVMAKAFKANDKLAANIIVITTFGSMFSLSLGLIVLKWLGLV
ncbi:MULTISPECIES: AEC family transporter [unclassified Salinicola]|uniref:AEC family transporter n=1 Tax=unclassified Salinicola TaxID=2634022 RepID=UPI001A8E3B2A|nr:MULTISPECIES: AEC family transporter [unclassified Salinicola]MCE3026120.1 AEC family transporter [Salinicola sp. DM10]WIX31335.1 AEC family transporter [Salinicola sp. JS01]